MKRALTLLTALLTSSALTSAISAAEPATLRQAAGDRLLIGAAISMPQIDDPKQAELLTSQFNSIVCGNDFKPLYLHPKPDVFNFETADKYVAFAEAHGLKLIGHNLLWHSQAPAHLFQDESGKPLPREQGLANLQKHITTIVTHFKGKVIGWDVVNEGLADSEPYLRSTPAFKSIGEDYIQKAFEFAHAADPDVELYYNDYNIEKPYKFPKALKLLKALKAANVPITGVGIQLHCMLTEPKTPAELEAAIPQFAALGLKVMFTELDVDVLPRKASGADVTAKEQGANPYTAGLPAEVAEAQGKYYASIFQVALNHPGVVTRVTTWGTDDSTSWLNDWPVRGRTNYGMLFARDLSPKPAFTDVMKVLTGK